MYTVTGPARSSAGASSANTSFEARIEVPGATSHETGACDCTATTSALPAPQSTTAASCPAERSSSAESRTIEFPEIGSSPESGSGSGCSVRRHAQDGFQAARLPLLP